MRTTSLRVIALVTALTVFADNALVAAQTPVPDLTKGGTKDDSHDWNLGPSGARGWIWGWNLETTQARQILITRVEPGSPAAGVLEVGDVIVGLNGAEFTADARRAFGSAITEAQKTENRGRLDLLLWRKGTNQRVTVQLKVMGSYSETAPEDCPKSKLIFDQACRHLAEHGLGDSIQADINALALLATGRAEYLDQVKALAHEVGPRTLKLDLREGMTAWTWGYHNLFLTEYFLATGDKYVLPAIQEYSKTMATGQSEVGTWGHGMVVPSSENALGGYGAINQAGLVCWLSLILAQKCGTQAAVVKQAVEKSQRFFDFYIGKGSIPYGDHAPYYFLHDSNGKNAQAAVAFDLLGDEAGHRFFSRMSTASYAEREVGHTGNYFSYLWGPLGVARAGRNALALHLKEQRWFYDLARTWDGGFTYQGGAGEDDSYAGWDTTGAFLLTYALPLHKLYITGKEMHLANVLEGSELQSVIECGRGFDAWHIEEGYRSKKNAELLAALGSWSPTVRFRAARALAIKQADVVPQLVTLLANDDLQVRYGACQALQHMGKQAAPAVDALIAQLSHKDSWLQICAAFALADIGAPARKAVPALLKLVLAGNPDDPRETTRRYLGIALFLEGFIDTGPKRGLLADSIDDVEPSVVVNVIRRLLHTDDGLVRAQIASAYDKLTNDELAQLWPDILEAVRKAPPSGEMYADGIRVAGLQLLAKHHVEEGMQACVDYALHQNSWGSESRMGEIMTALQSYGATAQGMLPKLRELASYCREERDFPDDCKKQKVQAVEHAIQFISASTDRPVLRSLALRPKSSTRTISASGRLKVFILAGQSNMEGPAVADLDPSWNRKDYNDGHGTLDQLLSDPAKAAPYRHLKDAQGHWAVRKDVWVHYLLEDGELKCGPLAPGFSPHGNHHFGPELQFGHVVGDCFDDQVLLIKTAWGGKSLYQDFRPPSSGGVVGPYYSKMIQQVRDALSNLSRDFPEYRGDGYELAGFVWYQGWNDGCDPQHAVPEYEMNLVHLIQDVRREFATPRLPVVIGELTGPWVHAEGEWLALRKAQAAAAAHPEFAGTVSFVETHDFVRKPEDSPNPEHGHHEFGNAETYLLVGNALGEAMKTLCTAARAK